MSELSGLADRRINSFKGGEGHGGTCSSRSGVFQADYYYYFYNLLFWSLTSGKAWGQICVNGACSFRGGGRKSSLVGVALQQYRGVGTRAPIPPPLLEHLCHWFQWHQAISSVPVQEANLHLVLSFGTPFTTGCQIPETERGNLYNKSWDVPWCKANGHPCTELCRLPFFPLLLLILASEGGVQVLGSPPDDLFSVNMVCFFLSYSVPSVLPFHCFVSCPFYPHHYSTISFPSSSKLYFPHHVQAHPRCRSNLTLLLFTT